MLEKHPAGPAIDVLVAAREIEFSLSRRRCLLALNQCYDEMGGFGYLSFRAISSRAGDLPLNKVKRAVHQLAKAGLATFARGLFSEDGEVAGAGYACTMRGHVVAEIILEGVPNDQ